MMTGPAQGELFQFDALKERIDAKFLVQRSIVAHFPIGARKKGMGNMKMTKKRRR